jgi:hypothetical protein
MRRFRFPKIVLGFLLAASLWAVVSVAQPPPQDQHIEKAESRTDANGSQHKIAKTFGERLSIIWERTWDDPVAFYTFILGIFTALLATVSLAQIGFLLRADKTARITAEAANLNAIAAIGSELPLVVVNQLGLTEIESAPPQAGLRLDEAAPMVSRLTLDFKNNGRTPAEAITQCVEWIVADKLPEIPDYRHFFPYSPSTFFPPDGQAPPVSLRNVNIKLTPGEIAAIAERRASLWVYGLVAFRDIVVGDRHEVRYCAKWRAYSEATGMPSGFVQDHKTPAEYTKRT